MSIQGQIAALEGTKLWRFEPPKIAIKRRLYLTALARRHLLDPASATNVLRLRGFIQSALIRWVSNGQIYGDERGRARFLKRLSPPPPEIWEVRVTDPTPQVRLLGRIVEPNTLILDRFHTRQYLGDKGDPGWKEAMSGCQASFEALFPGEPLFQPKTINECVTENCDDFRI